MVMMRRVVGFGGGGGCVSKWTNSLVWMGTLHLIFWFVATFFGLRFLENGFSFSHARSTAGLNTWIIIFILVVLQMTTALRPIIGKDSHFFPTTKKFFLTHWADNMNLKSNENGTR